MTEQEFVSLPTNKNSMNKLQAISSKGFASMEFDSFESQYWVFFGEAAQTIRTYLAYPKAIKRCIEKPTMESFLNSMRDVKKQGYRKELNMPF